MRYSRNLLARFLMLAVALTLFSCSKNSLTEEVLPVEETVYTNYINIDGSTMNGFDGNNCYYSEDPETPEEHITNNHALKFYNEVIEFSIHTTHGTGVGTLTSSGNDNTGAYSYVHYKNGDDNRRDFYLAVEGTKVNVVERNGVFVKIIDDGIFKNYYGDVINVDLTMVCP